MTLQNTLKIASVLAIVAILPALGLAASDNTAVAYLEGTIKDVPAETTGQLDLKDSENLLFRYDDTSYAIPFESLLSYEWGKPADGFSESMSKVGRSVMPMFYDSKFLTLRFEDGDDMEKMIFAIPKKMASSTTPVLDEWVIRNHKKRASAIVDANPDRWWGNRYWKTKRNKSQWEDAKQKSAPRSAGTVASRDEE